MLRVYPRVGGGTLASSFRPWMSEGLSPRGRGNPRYAVFHDRVSRSIPAWAGEPYRFHMGRPAAWVYPRVGGGTMNELKQAALGAGLSPRGRGNRYSLSPEARGGGSIPAWAGEPRSVPCKPNRVRVYPRVGGGTEDSVGTAW